MANDIVYNIVGKAEGFVGAVAQAGNAARQFQLDIEKTAARAKAATANPFGDIVNEVLRARSAYKQGMLDAQQFHQYLAQLQAKSDKYHADAESVSPAGRRRSTLDVAEEKEAANRQRNLERLRQFNVQIRDQELADEQKHILKMEAIRQTASDQKLRIDQQSAQRSIAERQRQLAVEQEAIERREQLISRAELNEESIRVGALQRIRRNYEQSRRDQLAIEQTFIELREKNLATAEAKEESNRNIALNRQRQQSEQRRASQLAAEQRQIEQNEHIASTVRRSLMTPRDFVVQDIMQAKAAWKSGELDAKHYFDFVAMQKRRLLAMNADVNHGYTGYGGVGARVTQQLAFGLEDFATQYSTMGVMGGIRAASNNVSAAGMMVNPMVGIATSLAATMTMVGIASYEASKKISDQTDSVKGLKDGYSAANSEIAKGIELQQKQAESFAAIAKQQKALAELSRETSSSGINSRLDDIRTRKDDANREVVFGNRGIEFSIDRMVESKLNAANEKIKKLEAGAPNALTNWGSNAMLEEAKNLRFDQSGYLAILNTRDSAEKARLAIGMESLGLSKDEVSELQKQVDAIEKQKLLRSDMNELEKEAIERKRKILDTEASGREADAMGRRFQVEQDLYNMETDSMKKRQDEIESLQEKFMSPREKFAKEEERIRGMMLEGLGAEEAAKAMEAARKDAFRGIEDLREKYASPAEKLRKRQEEIEALRRDGLDEETANKAMRDAQSEAFGASRWGAGAAVDARGQDAMSGLRYAMGTYLNNVPTQATPAEQKQIQIGNDQLNQLKELLKAFRNQLTPENLAAAVTVVNF